MAKPRPKTGEPRTTHQPLGIDRLPPSVHEAIKRLRARYGMTWLEIERLSALPYNKEWDSELGKHGFVDWAPLDARVLDKFPERRLPDTSLHRWYDLRVAQVLKEIDQQGAISDKLAKAFAGRGIEGADAAVMNAARDVIFQMLQAQDEKGRDKAAAGLIALADVMNGAKRNVIRERKVAVDERAVAQMEKDAEAKRARFEQETSKVSAKLGKGKEITRDDINRLRERVFGLPPVPNA